MKVNSYFHDVNGQAVWAYITNEGRGSWFGVKDDKLPSTEKDFLKIAGEKEFDPAKLPHIENMDPVLYDLWKNLTDSENCMWFVDREDIWGDVGPAPWKEKFHITQEEYERRVDGAIEKYGLFDVIEKGGDEDAIYTCYGDLMSRFSENIYSGEHAAGCMNTVADIFDTKLNKPFLIWDTCSDKEVSAQFREDGLYLYKTNCDLWIPNNQWLIGLLLGRMVRCA